MLAKITPIFTAFFERFYERFEYTYGAAWRIFTNLGVALKANWFVLPLTAIIFEINDGSWLMSGICALALFVAGCVCAVGWHRFCLLGEMPPSLFYLPPADRLIDYVIASLKLMFIAIIGATFIVSFFLLTPHLLWFQPWVRLGSPSYLALPISLSFTAVW